MLVLEICQLEAQIRMNVGKIKGIQRFINITVCGPSKVRCSLLSSSAEINETVFVLKCGGKYTNQFSIIATGLRDTEKKVA